MIGDSNLAAPRALLPTRLKADVEMV